MQNWDRVDGITTSAKQEQKTTPIRKGLQDDGARGRHEGLVGISG